MKRIHYLFLFLPVFICFSLAAQNNQERTWIQNTEKIRIISYNILDGFDGLKDKDRMSRITQWIAEKDPEILALQELVGFKEKDLHDFAESYGHTYSIILKEKGYPVGISSKRPIEVVGKFVDDYWHGFLHVRTFGLDIIILHLSPSDQAYRYKEANKITQYIKDNCPDNCLVMGDFNSVSPFDADEQESHLELVMERAKAAGVKEKEKSPAMPLFDYSVQATFMATPLLDICRMYVNPENRTTFPTRILTDVSKRNDMHKRSGSRIDYILVSPALYHKCVDAFIWNGEDTDYLSDHYPIGVDLLIKR